MSTDTQTIPKADCSEFPMPTLTKEHAFLNQFAGEWESEGETYMGPDQPPGKLKGTESTYVIGGMWAVGHIKGGMDGGESGYEQTYIVGFDSDSGKYVGSVVDNMTTTLWKHNDGFLDEAENKIVTFTEGPFFGMPGTVKFRETSQFKNPDHRLFTSEMQGPDGEWTTMLTVHVRRKK